jgi:hypothetical protein
MRDVIQMQPADGQLTDRWRWPPVNSVMSMAAGGIVGLTLLAYAVIVPVHLGDRYNVDFIGGIWIALAHHVNSGTLYPPLYDGASFGGTRYMPVFFVLHAGVAQLVGDHYVLAGKLLTFATLSVLIGLTFVVIRRMSVPRSVAALLAMLVVLTGPGFHAATSIRADALAALFQLSAVTLIARRGSRAAAPAAALSALGVFTKLSAVWAPAAIAVWLFVHHRRECLRFAATFGGLIVAGGCAVQIASNGSFLANLAVMTFGGVHAGLAAKRSTIYMLEMFVREAPAIWALVPFMIGSCALAARRRELNVYHLAWFTAVAVLLAVMADSGTDANHFVEPIVLGCIVAGALWQVDTSCSSPIRVGLVLATLWVAGTALVLHARLLAHEPLIPLLNRPDNVLPCGASAGRSCLTVDALLAKIRPAARVLSEDPSIVVARGDIPTVLDPWAIPRIEARHPGWVASLAARIDAGEFDWVILLMRYETTDPDFRLWYADEFGPTVMSAIERRYEWVAEIDGLHLYAPR